MNFIRIDKRTGFLSIVDSTEILDRVSKERVFEPYLTIEDLEKGKKVETDFAVWECDKK